MRVEAWEDEHSACVFPSDITQSERDFLMSDMTEPRKVFECECASWAECMQRWHDFKGWERYVPME